MSILKLASNQCWDAAQQLGGVKDELYGLRQSVSAVRNSLQNGVFSIYPPAPLQRLERRMEQTELGLDRFASTLRELLELYETTEMSILVGASRNAEAVRGRSYRVDSILFDDEGSYGGDQGSMTTIYNWDPVRCWALLAMLREYYPGISIFQAMYYFSTLNQNGCSYVALANTLFLQYEGRPEEFERRFGFPMYQEDGDLNYNRLILDIYARTDRTDRFDGANGLPKGPTLGTIRDLYQNYLDDRGIPGSSELRTQLSPAEYRANAESGNSVILLIFNQNMYDADGNAYFIDGGHAVTITGVTADGRYAVSSWGGEYYVDPAELTPDGRYMIMNYHV